MSKYDSVRKISRNNALYQLKMANPDMSFEELGKFFTVSKARAHKIFNKEKERRESIANYLKDKAAV